MCFKETKYFPNVIITLLRFQGFWPKNDGYATILHGLKVCVFYWFTNCWIFFGCSIHVFVYYNSPTVDVADSVVGIFVESFLVYAFSLYFMKINNIVDFVRDLENFREFGEPKTIQAFKRKHNFIMKSFCVYCIISVLIYTVLSYLDGQVCEERNQKHHKNNVCGLLVPLWLPITMNSKEKYILITMQALVLSVTLVSALTVSYFFVTCFDMIVIRLKHLKSILEAIPLLTEEVQKESMKRCVKYHICIIRLTKKCNKCFGDINAVHFSLSSLILGILNHQTMKELQLKGIFHLLGWLLIMYLLCDAGQKMITESLSISTTLYFLNWYDYDSDIKLYIRMMMMRAQQPLSFTAGIFNSYSFELLLVIVRASYTYMTVMANLQRITDQR